MTKQAKRTLGFFIVGSIVVFLLVMVTLSDKYGAWVWGVPAVLGIVGTGISLRYGAVRRIAAPAATGALDAIGEWANSSGSGRIKERRHIPADIRRQVRERAGETCEHPDCNRRTRNHFHHVDEDPSHNVRSNIVYICPNHHDEAHRGMITRDEQKRWARKRVKTATTTRSRRSSPRGKTRT